MTKKLFLISYYVIQYIKTFNFFFDIPYWQIWSALGKTHLVLQNGLVTHGPTQIWNTFRLMPGVLKWSFNTHNSRITYKDLLEMIKESKADFFDIAEKINELWYIIRNRREDSTISWYHAFFRDIMRLVIFFVRPAWCFHRVFCFIDYSILIGLPRLPQIWIIQ